MYLNIKQNISKMQSNFKRKEVCAEKLWHLLTSLANLQSVAYT